MKKLAPFLQSMATIPYMHTWAVAVREGGAVPQPAVYAGSPDSPSDYDVFEDNGITVYIRKDVKAEKDTLTVTLVKMLWMETLTVTGMAY